jgi:hypothetical protein
MSAINQQRVTVVLKPRPDEDLSAALSFLTLGSTVQIGRAGAVVASVGEGDQMEEVERLQNQLIIAEAAMRRGTMIRDQDHWPALRRVIAHVPVLYLEVADAIKQQALDDGDDLESAEEAAGQAIRVLVTFKQRLEGMLEPDLLSVDKDHVNQISKKCQNVNRTTEKSSVVAETPYAQVRVTNIDEWIRTVTNARRYEWLRDHNRVKDEDTNLVVARDRDCFYGPLLDLEVDEAMRLERLLEKHGEPV